MTLLERTLALKTRAAQLGDVHDRVEEVRRLDYRLSEVTEAAAGLPEASAKMVILKQAGLSLGVPPPSVGQAQALIERVRARFASTRKAEELTKGKAWERLLKALTESRRAVRSDLETLWHNHLETLFAGQTPNQYEAQLAKTDQNEEVLARYRSAYGEFRELLQKLPDSAQELEKARAIARRLAGIAQEFDLDVPTAVNTFLDAVAQGGAPFHLLTEEVRDWLASNSLTDRYRVVAVRP